MRQTIRFCRSRDGVRLAFSLHGSGPPLVRVATGLTHLQYDWDSPLWRHWLDGLSDGRTLVRYDERGSGLSDRAADRFSVDAWVEGAAVMGVRHGLYCLGCCWLLMALLFVVGTMHLVWMAVISGFVLAEKVIRRSLWTSYLPAALLIGWGATILLRSGR